MRETDNGVIHAFQTVKIPKRHCQSSVRCFCSCLKFRAETLVFGLKKWVCNALCIFFINNTCQSLKSRWHRSNRAEHFNRSDFPSPSVTVANRNCLFSSPLALFVDKLSKNDDATQPSSSDIASARAPTTIARDLANWIYYCIGLLRSGRVGMFRVLKVGLERGDGQILQRKKKVMALSYQYKHNVRRELRRYKAAQKRRRRETR